MILRIAGILSVSLMLVLLANVRPAVCEGWALPNPFASETKTKAKKPSALDKVATGTKTFFSQTAETLGLKKSKPKKRTPLYAHPVRPSIQPRQKESKSWFGWLSQSEEPKRDQTVTEWMSKDRLDP